MKNINEPILTNAEYPTFVDSLDCNFALKIEAKERGIKDIIKICKLGIPSEYSGKSVKMIDGAKK